IMTPFTMTSADRNIDQGDRSCGTDRMDFADRALSAEASGAGADVAGAACADVGGAGATAGGAAGVLRDGTVWVAGAAVCWAKAADAAAPSASTISNLRMVLNITAQSPARRTFVMPVSLTISRTIPRYDQTKALDANVVDLTTAIVCPRYNTIRT